MRLLAIDRVQLLHEKRHLLEAGVPRRYVIANMSEVTPALHGRITEYVANLDEHMETGHGLTIIGPWGSGKTHAAIVILDAVLRAPGRVTAWCHGPTDEEEYEPIPVRESYTGAFCLPQPFSEVLHRPGEPGNRETIDHWSRCDMLVVDDFQALYLGQPWDRSQLENLMKTRHADCRATILTMNDEATLKRADLGGMADRLRECNSKLILGSSVTSRRGA